MSLSKTENVEKIINFYYKELDSWGLIQYWVSTSLEIVLSNNIVWGKNVQHIQKFYSSKTLLSD